MAAPFATGATTRVAPASAPATTSAPPPPRGEGVPAAWPVASPCEGEAGAAADAALPEAGADRGVGHPVRMQAPLRDDAGGVLALEVAPVHGDREVPVP